MTISAVGRRYASALISLASEANAVEQVGRDLRDFAASWKDNRPLRAVFENPSFSSDTRRHILRDVAAQAGMHPYVRDLILLLSDRRRLGDLLDVVDSFESLAAVKLGRLRAEVTTAAELPEAYFTQLQSTLKSVTGKDVVLVRKIDPALLGGVITRIGDRVFDGSIRHQLQELRDELLS